MIGNRSPTFRVDACPSIAVMSAWKIDSELLRLVVANAAALVIPIPRNVAPPPKVANRVKPATAGGMLLRKLPKFRIGARFCHWNPYVSVEFFETDNSSTSMRTWARGRERLDRIWRAA